MDLKKNVALMVYGQFRNYKKNLRNNIRMLEPFLNTNNINVHVFLLTNKLKDGNYSPENENEILSIFKEFNYQIGFVKYIEDCNTRGEEEIVYNQFMTNIKHDKGVYSNFLARAIYRKYLINQLKNQYITENNIQIDLNVFCRLFDMNIHFNKNPLTIANEVHKIYDNPNILLGASDTFFIGTNSAIDYLFHLSELYKVGKVYHDDIWDDMRFFIFYFNYDSCLALLRHTYSPEVQYMAHIFYSDYRYQNIRFNYNNPNSEYNLHMLYHITCDPERFSFE